MTSGASALCRAVPPPPGGKKCEGDQDSPWNCRRWPSLRAGVWRRIGRCGAAGEPAELVDSRLESPGVISLPEFRDDEVADDAASLGVRDGALQPVADLNAHLPVLDGDHDKNAVIFMALADAPLFEEPDGEVHDRAAAEGGENGNRHLIAGLAFVGLQACLHPRAGVRGQDPGEIIDEPRGRWKLRTREPDGNGKDGESLTGEAHGRTLGRRQIDFGSFPSLRL